MAVHAQAEGGKPCTTGFAARGASGSATWGETVLAGDWLARGVAAAFAGTFAGALRTRAAFIAIQPNSNALARQVRSKPAMTQSPCGTDTPRWRDVVNALTTGTKASDAAATASRSCHLRRWNRNA
ncbi:hypothetical protein G6F68_019605 [Rhizopus microsporus]|nr:hypothetical protein G6F68_019605 [Rhizopus microsporus]